MRDILLTDMRRRQIQIQEEIDELITLITNYKYKKETLECLMDGYDTLISQLK